MTDWSAMITPDDRRGLRRSPEPLVAGVCGGVEAAVGVNRNIIRAGFIVFSLAGGAGFLAYLGAWTLMPSPTDRATRGTRSVVLGSVLLAVATIMALLTIGGVEPVGVIVFGLVFFGVAILNRRPDGAPVPVGSPPPPPWFEPDPSPVDWPPPPVMYPVDDVAFHDPVQLDPVQLDPARLDPAPLDLTVTPPGFDRTSQFDPTAELRTADGGSEPVGTESATHDPATAVPTTEIPIDPTAILPDGPADETRTIPEIPIDPQPIAPRPIAPLGGSSESMPTSTPPPPRPPPPVAPQPGPVPPAPSGLSPFPDPHDVGRPVPPTSSFGDDVDHQPRAHWAVARTADETILGSPRKPRPSGPPLASITMASLIALLGLALVFNTIAGAFVGAVAVAGAGTAIVGLMITISAFSGRTLSLIPLAILMLAILPAAPTIDHAIRDGTGSTNISVGSMAELQSSYRLGVGDLRVDFADLELTEDRTVDVAMGTGAIEVVVPADAVVQVRAESVVGYVWVFGEERAGIGTKLTVRPPSSADQDAPQLILNISTKIGAVDVYRDWRPIEADG